MIPKIIEVLASLLGRLGASRGEAGDVGVCGRNVDDLRGAACPSAAAGRKQNSWLRRL